VPSSHAIVLVSGGAAVTPFTTPDLAAGSGQPAGNTMTALRRRLLDAGASVYTAPARIGAGRVTEDAGWEGFADAPGPLPEAMTINSVGGIDEAGAALDAFLAHLAADHGIESLDLVGHSMGGLFARAAIGRRDPAAAPVRRLVTLGTPWTGALLGDFHVGDLALEDAHGDATTERILREARRRPTPEADGTAAWSLSTLKKALRSAPDGLPNVSTFTIWRVLHEAGATHQRSRSWCPTGTVVRVRKTGSTLVTDPDASAKKKSD